MMISEGVKTKKDNNVKLPWLDCYRFYAFFGVFISHVFYFLNPDFKDIYTKLTQI